jgi:hypothetical protein
VPFDDGCASSLRVSQECRAPGGEVVAYQQHETAVIAPTMSAIKSRLRQTNGPAGSYLGLIHTGILLCYGRTGVTVNLALLLMAQTNAVRDEL